MELDNDKKIEVLKHRINFWQQLLDIAKEDSSVLLNSQDQIKIQMNTNDIRNRQDIVDKLQSLLDELTQ